MPTMTQDELLSQLAEHGGCTQYGCIVEVKLGRELDNRPAQVSPHDTVLRHTVRNPDAMIDMSHLLIPSADLDRMCDPDDVEGAEYRDRVIRQLRRENAGDLEALLRDGAMIEKDGEIFEAAVLKGSDVINGLRQLLGMPKEAKKSNPDEVMDEIRDLLRRQKKYHHERYTRITGVLRESAVDLLKVLDEIDAEN